MPCDCCPWVIGGGGLVVASVPVRPAVCLVGCPCLPVVVCRDGKSARCSDVLTLLQSGQWSEVRSLMASIINVDNQTSLRNLSAHTAALDLLRCPLPHDASPESIHTILGVFRLCHQLLQAFCLRNTANQDVLFPHLPLFTEQLSLGVGAEDTITALFLENRRLCTAVDDDVFWELAAQIERAGREPNLLRPFVAFMRCGDVPIKKNQTRTLQVLIQPSLTQPMLLYNTPEQKQERKALFQVWACARARAAMCARGWLCFVCLGFCLPGGLLASVRAACVRR
jgi:hypothetical protein